MSQPANHPSAWFVQNKDGKGFRATKRGKAFLRLWDILSWLFAVVFFWMLITEPSVPWWLFVLAVPFSIAPLLGAMLVTGRGPLGAMLEMSRRLRGAR